MSTNKVYGDAPNELAARRARDALGLRRPGRRATASTRRCRIDATHAQPLRRVEGRGRRAGAGVRPLLRHADRLLPRRLPHRAEPLRRRAARLPRLPRARASREGRTYRIFGYKGKQVRDNIHSLRRLHARSMAFAEAPRAGEVYNLGGGRGEQRLDARGDRRASRSCSAGSSTSSTSTSRGAATTSATSATSRVPRRLSRAGS